MSAKTERQMREMVRECVAHAGGLRAWCRDNGVNAGQVSSWLASTGRPCPPIVADALGYRRVVRYAPKRAPQREDA